MPGNGRCMKKTRHSCTAELPRKKNRLASDAKRKRDGIRAKTMDFVVVANNLPKTDVYIPKKSINFFAILNGALIIRPVTLTTL